MTMDFRLHTYAAARKKNQNQNKSGPPTTTRVDPDAHALALILAGNNPARLHILSATTVLVLNRARSRTRTP